MRRRKSPTPIPVIPHHMGLAYCAQCGQAVGDYFHIGEMVLVESGRERPFYAQIRNIIKGDSGPEAIVSINPQENAKVSLANIRKVDV